MLPIVQVSVNVACEAWFDVLNMHAVQFICTITLYACLGWSHVPHREENEEVSYLKAHTLHIAHSTFYTYKCHWTSDTCSRPD
jgi:hypothetical protein